MPEAVTNVLRPASVPIISIALPARVLNAIPNWPSVTSLMTPSVTEVLPKAPVTVLPAFRYAAIASPDAIPVTLGWGIDFFILLLFGLFLRTYARRAVFRTPPLRVERLVPLDRR